MQTNKNSANIEVWYISTDRKLTDKKSANNEVHQYIWACPVFLLFFVDESAPDRIQGSISSTFYVQLLHTQIPKA